MARETVIKLPPEIDRLVIPASLMDTDRYAGLNYAAILLYAVLDALPKETNEDGEESIEIAAADIQNIMGCKETAFRANLNALKRAGLVECSKPRFGGVLRYIVKEAA